MDSGFICVSFTCTAVNSQNRVRVQTTGSRVIVKGEPAKAASHELWRNGKQTTATRGERLSWWNSKHHPISGRTHLEAAGMDSFINLERRSNARRAYGSVSVPSEPSPHGSAIIRRLPDKLGTGCSSRGSFFRRRYLIEGGGTRHYLKSPGAHGGNYVPTLLFGSTPTVQMKSQKTSWQPLLSRHWTPPTHTLSPCLNHYFFLCSGAQPMIRGSQGLISTFQDRGG